MHTDAFTQRNFHAQRNDCAEQFLHTEGLTHRNFLHRETFARKHRKKCTHTHTSRCSALHTKTLRRGLCTEAMQVLLFTRTFTQRHSYTQRLEHNFDTQKPLQTGAVTQRSCTHTQKLWPVWLHVQAPFPQLNRITSHTSTHFPHFTGQFSATKPFDFQLHFQMPVSILPSTNYVEQPEKILQNQCFCSPEESQKAPVKQGRGSSPLGVNAVGRRVKRILWTSGFAKWTIGKAWGYDCAGAKTLQMVVS